jgi:AcrR family transcriptional regulator
MKTLDRRTLKTRKLLREALLASVLERGWEKTTAQSVCEHVGVGKSTFSAHFADKEELLLSAFDDLPGTLKRVDERPFSFVRDLIVQVRDYYPLTRALRKRAFQTVSARLHDVVMQLVMLDVEPRRGRASEAERDVTARFIGGAIVDAIVGWIDDGARLDVRTLEGVIRRMSTAALAQLATPTTDTLRLG